MIKINLPKELLQKDAFKTLPAKEKEEYLSNSLKKILELNPEGITISQIKEATGFTYSTIWHHLEMLSCTAQCNKVSHGNTDVYYPSGNVKHLDEYDRGKILYSISTVKNNEGNFVCIHEKRENRSGNQIVSKGANIPVELIDEFIKTLTNIKNSHLDEEKNIKI